MAKDVVHVYTMEYYSAIKKNEIMPFAATWMQLEITILSKVSQKEKDRDFPGGAVVKNPPANAGDMGSSPGPGRSHMPWSN